MFSKFSSNYSLHCIHPLRIVVYLTITYLNQVHTCFLEIIFVCGVGMCVSVPEGINNLWNDMV